MKAVDKSFNFMESYYRSINKIKDPSVKLFFLESLIKYGLFNEEPVLNNDIEIAFFEEMKSHIDLSMEIRKKRAEAGKKGGEANTSKDEQTEASSSKDEQSKPKRKEKNGTEKNRNELNPLYKDLPSEMISAMMNFEEMRKKMKKPLTDHARELILKKLFDLSEGDLDTMIQLIDRSIVNGWSDVYPLSNKKNESISVSDIIALGSEMERLNN